MAFEKPIFLVTEHMKNSIGRGYFKKSPLMSKASLISSSEAAPFLSILFPRIAMGIFASSWMFSILSNSFFA